MPILTDPRGTWIDESLIDHDALLNWVANKHIDHSTISITGAGLLTGQGGDITASRVFTLNNSDVDHDAITNTHNLTTDIDHDTLTNWVANKHLDWTNETNDLLTTGTGTFGHLRCTDEALLAGTFASGWTEPNTGAGTRMLWYPRKAAFRAGRVTGTQWNNANIGDYSFACGVNTTASGLASFCCGYGLYANSILASGLGSFAFGYVFSGILRATAQAAVARGFVSGSSSVMSAQQLGSFVGGYLWGDSGTMIMTGSGPGCFVNGFMEDSDSDTFSMIGSGQGCFVNGALYGNGNSTGLMQATNDGSFLSGYCYRNSTMTSSGKGSFAVGYANSGTLQATGTASAVIGENVQATANNAYAFGKGIINSTVESFMVGWTTVGFTIQEELITIGSGKADIDYQLKFNGETNDGILTFMEDEKRFDFDSPLAITSIKSGATQVAAGAAANEIWKTNGHATLPNNVLMIGV